MSKKKCTDGRKNNRTPVKNRFGQPEGNPINLKGAPSKAEKLMQDRFSHEAMRRAFLDAGKEMITMHDHNGDKIRIPKIDALPKTLLNEGLKGNMRAVDLYMRYTDRYAKAQDDEFFELCELTSKMEERRFQASLKPGSHEHYEAMYNYFMLRRTMRRIEGIENWYYLDDEPITKEDWKVFMEYYESFKSPNVDKRVWPPPYPTHLEEVRLDNMNHEERAHEHMRVFKHRKEMREKEGLAKWPYLIEEPVDAEDWQHFEQHIQDRLNGKAKPAPWPPEGWGDEPEE